MGTGPHGSQPPAWPRGDFAYMLLVSGGDFFLLLLLLPPLQWIAVRLSVINWPPSKLPAFFSFFPPPLPTAASSIIRCAVATGRLLTALVTSSAPPVGAGA